MPGHIPLTVFFKPSAAAAPAAPAAAPPAAPAAPTAAPTPTPPLVCFTDGACLDNGKRNNPNAGYAVVWPNHPALDAAHRMDGNQGTNNRAEFSALVCALETALRIDPDRRQALTVYTDSQFMIDCVTKWLPGWRRNGYLKRDKTPVANRDLLERIDALMRARQSVMLKHVRAHTGAATWEATHNARADRMARAAAMPLPLPPPC